MLEMHARLVLDDTGERKRGVLRTRARRRAEHGCPADLAHNSVVAQLGASQRVAEIVKAFRIHAAPLGSCGTSLCRCGAHWQRALHRNETKVPTSGAKLPTSGSLETTDLARRGRFSAFSSTLRARSGVSPEVGSFKEYAILGTRRYTEIS